MTLEKVKIANNPFLGPQWEPLAAVLVGLLNRVAKQNGPVSMQTYGLKYSLQPNMSPYFQALRIEEGILVELSSNIICQPPLTADNYYEMQFLGWTAPADGPDGWVNASWDPDASQDSPNFVRTFGFDFDAELIASEILTALTSIYEITDDDYFGFGDSDWVGSLSQLKRLPATSGNPNRDIFVLPSKDLNK